MQLGGDTLAEAARGWGWESDIPFDLPVAASRVSVTPGFLDDPVAVAETAFGQGELLATPLQMALVAAGIANDGEIMRPHLVASPSRTGRRCARRDRRAGGGGPGRGRRSDRRHDGLRRRERRAGDGLCAGLHNRWQDRHRRDGSGDPHAWFIGFIGLPGEEPRYAVAVVVEAGGGGGQVALPIGRDFLVAAMSG